MARGGQTRILATLLFTDIVGSTVVAEEMGDRRWRELLARHHRLIRSELKRFGGRELDTAGDGFFAMFDAPASAIRCACAVSDAVRALGVEIRAGVHIGECEVLDGKVSGVNVHVAARTMALAHAGEVLVTGGILDLVRGAGFGFTDRDVHELKGVEGEWHLFEVTSIDGTPRAEMVPEVEAKSRRDAVEPPPLATRRSVHVVAAVAVLALVIAVAAVALNAREPSKPTAAPLRITSNAVARMDPKTGRLTAVQPLPGAPVAIASGEGAIWVAGQNGTVSRVDPATQHVLTIGVSASLTGIAVGEGVIWVLDAPAGELIPINATTSATGDPIGIQTTMTGVAFGDGALWVAGPQSDSIDGVAYRIDPATREVTGHAVFRAGFMAENIAIGVAGGRGFPVGDRLRPDVQDRARPCASPWVI